MTRRSGVACSFLALVAGQKLQARLDARGHEFEWADVIGDLDRLQLVEVGTGREAVPAAERGARDMWKVFQTVGVALPPTVQHIPIATPGHHAAPGATPPD